MMGLGVSGCPNVFVDYVSCIISHPYLVSLFFKHAGFLIFETISVSTAYNNISLTNEDHFL